jgi:hypothetical protein
MCYMIPAMKAGIFGVFAPIMKPLRGHRTGQRENFESIILDVKFRKQPTIRFD